MVIKERKWRCSLTAERATIAAIIAENNDPKRIPSKASILSIKKLCAIIQMRAVL
jgi:hypothetical protein